MKKIFILLILGLGIFQYSVAQNSVFTTPPLAGGNGAGTGGITFNMRANTTILLDSIYVALYGTANAATNITVWYNPNPINGSPSITAANGWIQHVASHPTTVGQSGTAISTPIFSSAPMNNLLMPAGSYWGFYVGVPTGSVGSPIYSSHTAASIDTFTNGTITIYNGPTIGYGGAFPTPTNHPRQFNGGMSYNPASGLDLRPSAIVSPATYSVGANILTIRAQNSAADPILSATIGYQIDNNPPVVVPTVNFSPTLTVGTFQDYTFATPINLPTSGSYTLKVWTTNANGLGPDNTPSNDTLTRTICTGISGTFTVGTPTSNYPTISAAVNALSCGLIGPVNFLIEPGTYTGNYTIQNVPGSGIANPISFSSLSGIAADVRLVSTTTSKTIFNVNGVTNVSFTGITFVINTAPTTDGGLLAFGSGAHNAFISGCSFIDSTTSASTFNKGIRFNNSDFSFVSNNFFSGFYYPTFYAGASATALLMAPTISDNQFVNYRYSAVYFTNVTDGLISDNTITDFGGTTAFSSAFYLINFFKTSIFNNQVLGGLPGYGLVYFSNYNGSELEPNLIYNNVYSGSTATGIAATSAVYGMYMVASFSTVATANNTRDYVEISNNTFNIGLRTTSTSALQSFMYSSGGSVTTPAISKVLVRNNIFNAYALPGNSIPAIYKGYYLGNVAVTDSLISNNNAFWLGTSNNPNLFSVAGTNYDMAAWRTLSGEDSSSVESNPILTSANAPIPSNSALNNMAIPLPYVPFDILGTPRSTTTPDPGAYEFNISGDDVGVVSVLSPNGGCVGSIGGTVSVLVQNFGTSSQSNIPIAYRLNGGTPVTATLAGPIAAGDTLTYTFPTPVSITTAGTFIVSAYTSLATDLQPLNDTSFRTVIAYASYTGNFPYLQNFENGAGGWIAGGSSSSWALGTPNSITTNGSLTTAASGVNAWVTNLNGTAAGGYNNSEISYIQSPCFNFSTITNAELRLNVAVNSEAAWDGGNVQYSTNGGTTWTVLGGVGTGIQNWYNRPNVSSSNGQPVWAGTPTSAPPIAAGWLDARHDISILNGQSSVLLRVNFTSDASVNTYFGLGVDDIQIAFPVEPSLDSITQANNVCDPTPTAVSAFVSNVYPITSVNLLYNLTGGVPTTSIPMTQVGTTNQWTATIPAAPGQGANVNYAAFVVDSAGQTDTSVILSYVSTPIAVSAGNDTTINLGDSATLVASILGFGTNGQLQGAAQVNNGCGGGMMMNVEVGGSPLRIDAFTVNPTAGGSQTVQVFYKQGVKEGFQQDQTAWISAGSYTINPTGAVPTFMAITPFVLQANTPYAIYLNYNNQYDGVGGVYSNNDLTILTGEGMCTPWTTCCNPRSFGGIIHYSSPVTVSWRELGTTTILSTLDTFVVYPTVTTTYFVTATDSVCTKTDTVTVFVNSVQAPDIEVLRITNPVQGSVINNSIPITVELKNIGNFAIGGFNVGYTINGSTIQTSTYAPNVNPGDSITYAFTPNWEPTQGGNYQVCVFVNGVVGDLNSSNDTICINISSTVNAKNISGADLVSSLYPNPAGNQLFVEFNNPVNKGNMNVFNSLGQSVLKLAINGENAGTRQTLDLTGLADGIYFLQLSTEVGEQTIRFQVIK